MKARARRLLDLQARTIWRDLATVLVDARGRVIDVGCGAQPYRGLLPAETWYVGIDSVEAKNHFRYDVLDTSLFSGDRWPVDDESADWVLCTETLEHVLDPPRFLGEAARCLRPNGRLVMTVPFAARWHYVPFDYWRFTPSSLRVLLENAGFANVAVYARGNSVTVACYKVMALVLPLLLPQRRGLLLKAAMVASALLLSPLLVFAAILAECSLLWPGGDDCLGYTVLAQKAG
jgi:SAM-dependent methyltransferase